MQSYVFVLAPTNDSAAYSVYYVDVNLSHICVYSITLHLSTVAPLF